MEHGRVILAIALSFLIFLTWNFFFVEKQKIEKEKLPQNVEAVKAVSTPAPAANEEPLAKSEKIESQAGAAEVKSGDSQAPKRRISVTTPLYAVEISEKDAAFKSYLLIDYRESVAQDAAFKQIIDPQNPIGSILLNNVSGGLGDVGQAIFTSSLKEESVDITDQPRTISFTWQSPQGIEIEKRYTFYPDSYKIGLVILVKNASDQSLKDQLSLSLAKHFTADKGVYGFQGPSGLINGKVKQIKIKKIEDYEELNGEIKWIALQDRYFMSAILPTVSQSGAMRLMITDESLVENQYVEPATVFNAGTQQKFEYELYFGPKSMKLLSGLNNNLSKAINFGMFDILAKPCLWVMNFIYDNIVPNYGIAIIMLTILTKIILWPLGNKSYKSMSEMKKIQPLMAEIREKYKGDKKKMNEEVMALYRTYKVNPMGGCLPMVVQIPVFFALYRMLYEAIELRHAPFFGWINDLSAPDRLFHFDFAIPLMQPPYGIPVLTIIMGASMFLQQKMSPPMGDPTQAKMMMFMPIIFTVIFINFSSGLVLYWLTNNILSMAQQYYVQKKTA